MLANFFPHRSIFSDFDRTFDRLRRRMEYDFREAFTPFEDFFAPPFSPFNRGFAEAERLLQPFFDSPNFNSLLELDVDKLTPPPIEDEEHTFYKMKVLTDHNGHVKTKTMEKEPGKEWQVRVEEYDRKTDKAIEQGKDNGNKSITDEKKMMAVENEGKENKEEVQIESEK